MNALKTEDEELKFRYMRIYEFQKIVNVGTATNKNKIKTYLDRTPAFSDGQKWLGNFRQGYFKRSTGLRANISSKEIANGLKIDN